MDRIKNLLLAILSGVILGFACETPGITILLFIAFVPLLIVEENLAQQPTNKSLSVFGYSYLTFFIFNVISTWWIYYASLAGAVMALLFNAFFMAVVFYLFHFVKQKVGKREGYIGWVLLWIGFEYLHLNWELSWPWLTLGNGFASKIEWVQWYEYTGHLGGSVWMLVINIIAFNIIQRVGIEKKKIATQTGRIIAFVFFLIVPIIWSYLISSNYKEKEDPIEVVVVQPNIDPYTDKFGGMSESDQIDRIFDLAESKMDENTEYVVAPETSFPANYWEHELKFIYGTDRAKIMLDKFPNASYAGGLSTARLYTEGENYPYTAQKFRDNSPGRYDIYNAAVQIDTSYQFPLHRKSKLVLGAEKMPFRKYLTFMGRLSIKLGGTSVSYGYQEHPTVFKNNEGTIVAPVICYESVYPEYVGEYIEKGAQLIFIITNDGWWSNTAGYKQHFDYAKILAVSYRRSIARSANTGISAFINQKGEVSQKTAYWEQAVIKGNINKNDERTFYLKYGDYLGRTAALFSLLLLLLAFVKSRNKTEQRLKM